MANVAVGQEAPDFTLRNENNQEITLSSLRGTPVVLVFYPLDFSGGWPPKRGFELVLDLTRTESRLRPGMSAVARIGVGRHDNQVLVPSRGLFTHGGRPVAYVVTDSGIEPRYVSVAHRNDDVTAIASGLSPGERVAVTAPRDADQLLLALEGSTR